MQSLNFKTKIEHYNIRELIYLYEWYRKLQSQELTSHLKSRENTVKLKNK